MHYSTRPPRPLRPVPVAKVVAVKVLDYLRGGGEGRRVAEPTREVPEGANVGHLQRAAAALSAQRWRNIHIFAAVI